MKGKFTILLAVGALQLLPGYPGEHHWLSGRMTGTNANDVISGFGRKDKIQGTTKQDVDTIGTTSMRQG